MVIKKFHFLLVAVLATASVSYGAPKRVTFSISKIFKKIYFKPKTGVSAQSWAREDIIYDLMRRMVPHRLPRHPRLAGAQLPANTRTPARVSHDLHANIRNNDSNMSASVGLFAIHKCLKHILPHKDIVNCEGVSVLNTNMLHEAGYAATCSWLNAKSDKEIGLAALTGAASEFVAQTVDGLVARATGQENQNDWARVLARSAARSVTRNTLNGIFGIDDNNRRDEGAFQKWLRYLNPVIGIRINLSGD